ncbi:MAG: hypothetical protein BJ554DRAFT_5602 [Olpidium bornovanus]|uniref:UmuC domain-containing protein n=1 Tax=Olpidium bornovanus TaxID=278681 RepID=A0A8H7ZZ49_9FUNG|nr:MAG: hypothetical protein BJ554DRAFT_5602 [Olpidium bornovanus]
MGKVADALRVCPELVVVNGEDLTPYRRANREVHAVLRDSLSTLPPALAVPIERLGLDEFYLDVSAVADALVSRSDAPCTTVEHSSAAAGSSCARSWNAVFMEKYLFGLLDYINLDDLSDPGDACRSTHFYPPQPAERREVDAFFAGALLALWFRREIKRALGFTCSAGVASTKLAAKLASGFHKPDDQSAFVEPAALGQFLEGLPARKLRGLGHRTLDTVLNHLRVQSGVELGHDVTTGDLRKHAGLQTWTLLFGERRGNVLYDLTRGRDASPVTNSGSARQHSIEDSFPAESRCASWPDVETSLTDLVARLIARLEEEEYDALSGRWVRRARTLRLSFCLRRTPPAESGWRRASKSVPMPPRLYDASEPRRDRAQAVATGTLVPLMRGWLPPTFDLTVLNVAAVGFPDDPAPAAASARDISSFMIRGKRTAAGHADAAEAKKPRPAGRDPPPDAGRGDVSGPSSPPAGVRQEAPGPPEGGALEADRGGTFTCAACGATLPDFCSLPHRLFHSKDGAADPSSPHV